LTREARRRAGLSQIELARRLGVSQPVVARWEADTGSITLENLARVLAACRFALEMRLVPIDDGAAHDWSLVEANLTRTPDERLAQAEAAANLVLAGRAAVRRTRDSG
jgi:transcriptional regulator with XRE-family HTH domain